MTELMQILPLVAVLVAGVGGWLAGRKASTGDYWAGVRDGWTQGVQRARNAVCENGDAPPSGSRLIRAEVEVTPGDSGVILFYEQDPMGRLRLQLAAQAARMHLPEKGGRGS
jgi:hypothetical protein